MQREATNSSVVLPPKYKFSFEAQAGRVTFAPGSLVPLAAQLGEVRAICTILNQAKINALDGVRRERVSADDSSGPATDYIDLHSVTNELAISSPYEVTFRCFTPELAAVLAGFANSPYGIIVKGVNVELATTVTDPYATESVTPVAVPGPIAIQPETRRPEQDQAFRSRYGRRGMPPPPTAAPTPDSGSISRGGCGPGSNRLADLSHGKAAESHPLDSRGEVAAPNVAAWIYLRNITRKLCWAECSSCSWLVRHCCPL